MVMDNSQHVPAFTATEKLWQTADRSRLVPDGDPEAAFLFCVPGQEVSPDDVKLYGIPKAAVAKKGEDAAKAQEPAEDKAVPATPENKAKRRPRTTKSK